MNVGRALLGELVVTLRADPELATELRELLGVGHADSAEAPAGAVTIAEAARLMSCSSSTVKMMVRAGRLRTVGVGRRGVRIPKAEIERWLAAASETKRAAAKVVPMPTLASRGAAAARASRR